jgi:hypothetical protein
VRRYEMRKALLLLAAGAAAVAVGALAPGAGAALSGDVLGPACADIVGGGFGIAGGTLSGSARTAEPACGFITYTLYVDGQPVATGTPNPIVDTVVGFSSAFAGSSGCVYATSSVGNHVFDRAPDSGCVTVEEGGSGGFEGFT